MKKMFYCMQPTVLPRTFRGKKLYSSIFGHIFIITHVHVEFSPKFLSFLLLETVNLSAPFFRC